MNIITWNVLVKEIKIVKVFEQRLMQSGISIVMQMMGKEKEKLFQRGQLVKLRMSGLVDMLFQVLSGLE